MTLAGKGGSASPGGARGGKPESGFTRLSTGSRRAGDRFEFWRGLHPNIDVEPAENFAHKNFRGELLHYGAPDGSTFGLTTSDDIVARFAQPNRDFVLISLTLAGSAALRVAGQTEQVVSARDGFVAIDSRRPLTTVTSGYKHLYLTIPRARVVEALDDDPDILRDGLVRLPSSGVAEILKSHMLMTARQGMRLDPRVARIAVGCGIDLALTALVQELDRTGHAMSAGDSSGLIHAAARRFIELHFDDSTLTAEQVAQAVGCSRAGLHRAFAGREEGVGGTIRRTRLDAASKLLASSGEHSVAQIAHACGFVNASSFARAFKSYSGTTPTTYRDAVLMA